MPAPTAALATNEAGAGAGAAAQHAPRSGAPPGAPSSPTDWSAALGGSGGQAPLLLFAILFSFTLVAHFLVRRLRTGAFPAWSPAVLKPLEQPG